MPRSKPSNAKVVRKGQKAAKKTEQAMSNKAARVDVQAVLRNGRGQ